MNDNREAVVQIKGLKKSYIGGVDVLKCIDLDVYKGETLVICGPSGTGKSTLIRCINGLEDYDAGEVIVGGDILVSQDRRTLHKVRKHVGIVFQQFNLFPHLTVLENCTLAQEVVDHKSRHKAVETARKFLNKVDILEKADSYPYQLSGGQQQRVAIARALCMEVNVMLYDEPTSSLDPKVTQEVVKNITKMKQEFGVSGICVTHSMSFAKSVADRVCFLNAGCVEEIATVDEFFNNPKTQAVRDFLRLR